MALSAAHACVNHIRWQAAQAIATLGVPYEQSSDPAQTVCGPKRSIEHTIGLEQKDRLTILLGSAHPIRFVAHAGHAPGNRRKNTYHRDELLVSPSWIVGVTFA
jgi:hypothetical protein